MKIKYRIVNKYIRLLKTGGAYSSLNKDYVTRLGGTKFPYIKKCPRVEFTYKIERTFHAAILSGGCEVMEISNGINSYFYKKDDGKYEGNYYNILSKTYIHEDKI